MNVQIKKVTVWLLATSLVLAAAAMLIPKNAIASIAAQVFLANHSVPASNPLPVSGNVGINNSPTVQLAPGTTVGVTGGTFNFSNTPSTPVFTRDKDNPALRPFQILLCSGLNDLGNNICGDPGSFVVDPNQRFVIEYVSVRCVQDGTGTVFYSSIVTSVGGNSLAYFFPIGQANSAGGSGNATANQQTRIYADPGKSVRFDATGDSGSSGFFFCTATLSGNLVTP
jgi:hypothetical protein